MHTPTCSHTHAHTHVHTPTCTPASTHTHMSTPTCTYPHAHTHVHTTHMHAPTCMQPHTPTCTHSHAHTHTHTSTHPHAHLKLKKQGKKRFIFSSQLWRFQSMVSWIPVLLRLWQGKMSSQEYTAQKATSWQQGSKTRERGRPMFLLKAYLHRTKLYILKHPTPPNTICDD